MKCQRCLGSEEASHRVYTDVMEIQVCGVCAGEARNLGISIELLDLDGNKQDRVKGGDFSRTLELTW